MSAVEWKSLEELGNFYGGLSGKSKEDFQDGNAKFVTYMNVYSNMSLDFTIDDMVKVEKNEKQNCIKYGDILFTGSSETPDDCGMSSVVTDQVDEPIYLNSFCFGFRFDDVEKFEPSFFKHYFRCIAMRKALALTASGVTRFNVSKKRLGKVQIPILSINEQREIGKNLDTFTTLISNLESELDMRRKQYEHYRNQLLDFEGVEGVEWKTLGEVGLFYGGLSGKSKEDFQDGNAKFVTYMNIYSNSSLDTTIVDMVKVGENEKQNSINYGDILFTGSSETPDDCGMSCVVTGHVDEPIYLNSFCFGFRFDNIEKFEPDFLKHYFRCTAMRKAIALTASGVTRFNVSKKRLGKVQIPILSINEQREIGKLLDTFTTLISNLEQEIKLRKQQYEYYREKLLTFE